MISSRNKAHETAMIIIYDVLTYLSIDSDFDIKEITSGILDEKYEDCDMYVKEVTVKAILHQDEIIAFLTPYLNKWRWERLARIIQAILIMSVAHYKYVGEVDKNVVINVAVTLAKRFASANDYKFVNAILDKSL